MDSVNGLRTQNNELKKDNNEIEEEGIIDGLCSSEDSRVLVCAD